MKPLLFSIAFLAVFTFKVSAQTSKSTTDTAKSHITEVVLMPPPPPMVASQDIAKHIGEFVTVCDKVYTTRVIEGSNLTLLNLGGNYPNQTLTVMIKGENRSKFKEQPEVYFKDKNICVSGKVIEYKGKPEIEVDNPMNLKLSDK